MSDPTTCPNGHLTAATDYCDTCGVPITATDGDGPPSPGSAEVPGPQAPAGTSAAGTPGEAPPPAAGVASGPEAASASGTTCPSCGTDNTALALFCEACGYDFTTGTMPRPPDDAGIPEAGAAQGGPAPSRPGGPDLGGTESGGTESGGTESGAPDAAAPRTAQWVAEMWVDPDWYAEQDSSDPCPSAGLPVVVPLTGRSALVGRPSVSRNIHPEVDCTADVGVSRRQAQLTTDGQRWWVEDLQSANGTYVGPASGPLPTEPLPPGQRRELAEDDRVYLGAWTRLVVRRATPEEQAGRA